MNDVSASLDRLAEQFLSYKRTLGVKYETGEYYLKNFLTYANLNNPTAQVPDKELVSGWCAKAVGNPGSLYNMASVIREFGKYLGMNGFDNAYILPPKRGGKLEPHLPHFFTTDEINAFFEHCDKTTKWRERPGRELVIPAVFRLLYCCGLRCREARMLLYNDVCLDGKHIDIKESKGRSRRIFISDELAEFFKQYDKQMVHIFPNRVYFFPRNQCEPYSESFISLNFNRVWMEALPHFHSPIKPRAFDFRHYFAYSNLNRWAEQGKDVNVMLAFLMRYMGHAHIQSTLYYFHFVPEYFGTFVQKARALESLMPEVPHEE
jgi:integrase